MTSSMWFISSPAFMTWLARKKFLDYICKLSMLMGINYITASVYLVSGINIPQNMFLVSV